MILTLDNIDQSAKAITSIDYQMLSWSEINHKIKPFISGQYSERRLEQEVTLVHHGIIVDEGGNVIRTFSYDGISEVLTASGSRKCWCEIIQNIIR